MLGALGGAAGLVLAYVGLRLLVAFGPTNLPRLQEISIDPSVLAFVIVASLVSSLLLGSIPAFKHAAQNAAPLSAARGATASRERHRARNALVVAQVALALVLIVCSGLMFRTFSALRDVDPGFSRPEAVQIARINITAAHQHRSGTHTRIQRQILDASRRFRESRPRRSASARRWKPRARRQDALYVEGQRYEAGRRRRYADSNTWRPVTSRPWARAWSRGATSLGRISTRAARLP